MPLQGIGSEEKFRKIIKLYDVAEELLQTVEQQSEVDPEIQLNLVEPMVEAVEESADALSEEYSCLAEGDSGVTKINKKRVENNLRKIFGAINQYKENVKQQTAQVAASVKKLTDEVVARLRTALEDVVAIFLEAVHISLDLIMQKQEIEEMKKRNLRLATLMHQNSLAVE